MPKYLKDNGRLCSDQPHNLFYIPPEEMQRTEIIIDGQELHYIKNVLRKNCGDIIFFTDGRGARLTAKIISITKSAVRTKIVEKQYIKRNNIVGIELAFVPLKGYRNDFIIEKGTELGIVRFRPFISKFSVVTRLSQTKHNRFKKIATSAMLQSQQYYMPEVFAMKDLHDLAKTFKIFDLVLLAEKSGKPTLPLNAKSILYIVGPEGGFDQDEITLLKDSGAIMFSLGLHRLRSETAALCGITKILTIYSIL